MTPLAPPDAQLHEILHLAAQLPNSQRRQRFLQIIADELINKQVNDRIVREAATMALRKMLGPPPEETK
jgi:hypothetical protein